MKVIQIKKVKNLYEVIFDKDKISYHEEVIIKYNLLKNDIELTKNEFELSILDNRFYLSKDKAIKYLKEPKFKSQIKKHLLKTEEEFIIKRVLDNLVENKIIDDYYTSILYVESKYRSGYGSIELSRRLNDYYVNKEIISKVIEETREYEVESINKYFIKLMKIIKGINKKDLKRKIENRLVTHGYLFEDIRDVLSKFDDLYVDEDTNNNFDKYFNKAIKKYEDVVDKYIREKKIREYLISKGFDISLVKEEVNNWKNTRGE